MTSLSDGLGPQKDPNSARTRVHSHRCKDSFHGTDVLAVSVRISVIVITQIAPS